MRIKLISLVLSASMFATTSLFGGTATKTLLIIVSNPHYIRLTWTGSPVGNVTYSLYRGTAPGAELPDPMMVNILDGPFDDHSVLSGTNYCYTVTVVTSTGAESAHSNEACAVAL